MSMLARAVLLILLSLAFVRLAAAESDELAALRAKAERGNALAQYNLGLASIQGRLGPADPAEAFAWLTLASENGATGKALDSLLGNITDEQLTEGKRRLANYRTALTSRSSTASHISTPKLAPRSFSIEAPPATPGDGRSVPATRPPEPVPAPVATTPAEGLNFSAEAFAWLTLASEGGPTGKALDSLLGNITDKQLAEGRRRLELYRATLSAKYPPASHTNLTKSAPSAPGEIQTSPADGEDLSELVEARKELEQAHAGLARLESEATEAATTIARLNAELTATRQPPTAAQPATATPAAAEQPQPKETPAHQP